MERPSGRKIREQVAEINSTVNNMRLTVEHDEASIQECHAYLRHSLADLISTEPADSLNVVLLLGALQSIEWLANKMSIEVTPYKTCFQEETLKIWDGLKLDLWKTAVTSRKS